MKEVWAEIPK
jgi:hypothetical protein